MAAMQEAEGQTEEWMTMLAPSGGGQNATSKAEGRGDSASSPDASALLSAVRARLVGEPARYRKFLLATSATPVDHTGALSVLRGHDDLIATFLRCFRDAGASRDIAAAEGAQAAIQDHRSAEARCQQLVQLIFAQKSGSEPQSAELLEFLQKRAADRQAGGSRRLILLRGPPGVNKAEWAQQELRDEVAGESVVAQLAHICSVDDFFRDYTTGDGSELAFKPELLRSNRASNEARVRLAMEVGLDPLYVDDLNLRISDMKPYATLAKRFGYEVTAIPPEEISPNWSDVDFLVGQLQAQYGSVESKCFTPSFVESMIDCFEALPYGEDPKPLIQEAAAPDSDLPALKTAAAKTSAPLPPSALLHKFEKLLTEGSELMRYTPPDGKGWGVNGEFCQEWQAFREKPDGTCTFDDGSQWHTPAAEAWSIIELAMLSDLRSLASDLPEAALPSAKSHPGLFEAQRAEKKVPAPPTSAPPRSVLASAGQEPAQTVPMSRVERLKHRMKAMHEGRSFEDTSVLRQEEETVRYGAAKVPITRPRVAVKQQPQAPLDDDEEVSAATFLAAVKNRLTDWGKVELYHEFVLALSGNVDVKSAVRILRGHDDLLRVFRQKFAPNTDIMAVKREIAEEPEEEDRRMTPAPRTPPEFGSVKRELSSYGGRLAAPNDDGPRPPTLPPNRGVKREFSSMEVKSEAEVPQPPKFPPSLRRTVVTVGDDSDEDEDMQDEASILAAVRKGRDECVAQLVKLVFRKERTAQDGAKERLAMIRYATQRAATPRFPREVFILRGAPGTGKTEYAIQQLGEAVEIEAEDANAARLTHVCSMDDFFEHYEGTQAVYQYDSTKVESYAAKNEMRVRLAMEAGIHPIYIDCPNLRHWEMQPYLDLADQLGYVTNIVEPQDICEKWEDSAFLASATDTLSRQEKGKVISQGLIAGMLKAFEPLHGEVASDTVKSDPDKIIRAASRPDGTRLVQAIAVPPTIKNTSKPKGQGKGAKGGGKNNGGGKMWGGAYGGAQQGVSNPNWQSNYGQHTITPWSSKGQQRQQYGQQTRAATAR